MRAKAKKGFPRSYERGADIAEAVLQVRAAHSAKTEVSRFLDDNWSAVVAELRKRIKDGRMPHEEAMGLAAMLMAAAKQAARKALRRNGGDHTLAGTGRQW